MGQQACLSRSGAKGGDMMIAVTTCPFSAPMDGIGGHDIGFNPLNRKYLPKELSEMLVRLSPDIIIAGTETYDIDMLGMVPNLRMVSRVGIGVDSVDLEECSRRGILVTNTPDAPSNAVAELTLAQVGNMSRRVRIVDRDMRAGRWNRFVGRDIRGERFGVIGCGRTGSLVARGLDSMGGVVMANDIVPERSSGLFAGRDATAGKDEIYGSCGAICLHVPKTALTHGMIGARQLGAMRRDVMLLNPSRGGIVDEEALYVHLKANPEASAWLDVFEVEPYGGKLLELDNCYVTPHLGSCTKISRKLMEEGAVEEVHRFLAGMPPLNRVA